MIHPSNQGTGGVRTSMGSIRGIPLLLLLLGFLGLPGLLALLVVASPGCESDGVLMEVRGASGKDHIRDASAVIARFTNLGETRVNVSGRLVPWKERQSRALPNLWFTPKAGQVLVRLIDLVGAEAPPVEGTYTLTYAVPGAGGTRATLVYDTTLPQIWVVTPSRGPIAIGSLAGVPPTLETVEVSVVDDYLRLFEVAGQRLPVSSDGKAVFKLPAGASSVPLAAVDLAGNRLEADLPIFEEGPRILWPDEYKPAPSGVPIWEGDRYRLDFGIDYAGAVAAKVFLEDREFEVEGVATGRGGYVDSLPLEPGLNRVRIIVEDLDSPEWRTDEERRLFYNRIPVVLTAGLMRGGPGPFFTPTDDLLLAELEGPKGFWVEVEGTYERTGRSQGAVTRAISKTLTPTTPHGRAVLLMSELIEAADSDGRYALTLTAWPRKEQWKAEVILDRTPPKLYLLAPEGAMEPLASGERKIVPAGELRFRVEEENLAPEGFRVGGTAHAPRRRDGVVTLYLEEGPSAVRVEAIDRVGHAVAVDLRAVDLPRILIPSLPGLAPLRLADRSFVLEFTVVEPGEPLVVSVALNQDPLEVTTRDDAFRARLALRPGENVVTVAASYRDAPELKSVASRLLLVDEEWIPGELIDEGYGLKVFERAQGGPIFRITPPAGASKDWVLPGGIIEVRLVESKETGHVYRVSTASEREIDMVLVKGGVLPLPGGSRATVGPFLIDRHEVTVERYAVFRARGGGRDHSPPMDYFNENYGNPRQPVVGVTGEDAEAFAAWAGKELPDEWQWEVAAAWDEKAEIRREFTWGGRFEDGRARIKSWRLTPAGPFPPPVDRSSWDVSPWGAFALGVGVREWCLDPDAGAEERYVIRGGTTIGIPGTLPVEQLYLTTRREPTPAGRRMRDVGFRCVVALVAYEGEEIRQ